MIKFTFEIEDVKGSLTRNPGGTYLLLAQDTESGEEAKKEITEEEAACILYSTFDVQVEDPYQIAAMALKDFPVELIP